MKRKSLMLSVVGVVCGALVVAALVGWMVWIGSEHGTTSPVAQGATTPAFVQEKDNQVTSGKTSAATFTSATKAGDLIVVYVIWNNTGTASISDSNGNAYVSAVGPSQWGSKYDSQIFYAKNIKGGTDTVTATFGTSITSFGIVYANEYSGLDQSSPFDVASAASSSSGTALNSGSKTTTNAIDLIFGAGVSANSVTAAGSGFATRSTFQGNMTEDKNVSAVGAYSATETQGASGAWAMQMVAFKAAAAATTTPPTVPTGLSATPISSSQINLSWTASTDSSYPSNQLSYGVYRNSVRIATTTAGTTSWSDTNLTASTTYTYTVSAQDPTGKSSAQSGPIQATTLSLVMPTINSFAANPASIVVSQSATLSWMTLNATSLSIDNGIGNVTGKTSIVVNPTMTTTYTLTAINSVGSTTAQTTVTVSPDTTPPSVPANLSAGVISTSQINLSWSASTDNVGVAGYQIFRNGFQVATSTGTNYSDTGLAASTTYNYTVTAFDAAGNVSAQSNPAIATTFGTDTTPPSVPTNVVATPVSTSQINLAWSASTDNVGVTGYQVFRNGLQISTSVATSYSDTGLTASTTYDYTVTAFDAAGNISAQSNPALATTFGSDTTPPTTSITSPMNNATVSSTIIVSATASDNVGVTQVQLYVDGNLAGTDTAAPYTFPLNTTTLANGAHTLATEAYDAAGNTGTSAIVGITVNNAGSGSRNYATNFPLTENPISENGNWVNGGANGIDWTNVQTMPGLAFGTETGFGGYDDSTGILTGTWGPNQIVQGTIHAVNQATSSAVFEEVELRLRTTVTAHSITGYEVNCSVAANSSNFYLQINRWNGALGSFTPIDGSSAHCENGDILKATINGSTITVYLNGSQVMTASDATYATGNPGMGFFLQGASGLNSNYGFTSFAATDGTSLVDTLPPSTPANLSGQAVSPSQINLAWTASTDNFGVAGYKVFRNGNQVATSTVNNFIDTGLAASTQYTYAVSAFDAAGNVSARSSSTVIMTPAADTTPPSVPTNLQASNVGSNSLTLSWSTSTDNYGVAGYQLFRNGGQIATTTIGSYFDSNVVPSTTYKYAVTAFDYSGNISASSSPLSVTTASSSSKTPPSFVQVNQNNIGSGTTNATTFNTATKAGNTIVVYVVWNNTGNVTLKDSQGDTFVSASGPLTWDSSYRAQVFYATNIVGGADTVTATFGTAITSFGTVYINEYSGINTGSPIDATAMASGASGSLNSGSATTTNPNDLVFGAGVSLNIVTAAGTGFTTRDTTYGNIIEDKVATTTGSYSATATQNGTAWAMQMVAFRSAH